MRHSSASPVFSLYYIGINAGANVTQQAFEEFVQNRGAYIPCYPGWRWTLLRGLRGERAGQYLMLYEIESAAMRDLYITEDGNQTPLARWFWRQHPEAEALLAEWHEYGTFSELPTLFTDYELLAVNRNSTVLPGSRYQKFPPVARVIGIHNLALRPYVSEKQFEKFIADNAYRIKDYPDWKFRLLKGERGNRLDQYILLMEIASMDALKKFYPEPDFATDEVIKFGKAHEDCKQMYREWKKLASFFGAPQIYTDYISVAESLS